MRSLLPLAALLALGLSACATVPRPLQGEFSGVVPHEVSRDGMSGTRVRWGGEIIKTEPAAAETCFEVLSRRLDSAARPTRRAPSDGRFIACRSGFYDPAEFRPGREITVTGTLTGSEMRQVGGFEYSYPKVSADQVWLWSPRPQYQYPPPYYDPWLMYGRPGWGPYWDPWWGAPPVIIHNPAPRPAPPRPRPPRPEG